MVGDNTVPQDFVDREIVIPVVNSQQVARLPEAAQGQGSYYNNEQASADPAPAVAAMWN